MSDRTRRFSARRVGLCALTLVLAGYSLGPDRAALLAVSTYRVVRPSGSQAAGGVVPDVAVPLEDAVERAAGLVPGADLP